MNEDKITEDDAVAFAEAVAQYIADRNPKLPGCLERALQRHPSDEFREKRHARIMWIAALAMGLGDLAEERVAVYRAYGAEWDAQSGMPATDDDNICRETNGLDSAIRRGIAGMEELDRIEALGKALVAIARAARGRT